MLVRTMAHKRVDMRCSTQAIRNVGHITRRNAADCTEPDMKHHRSNSNSNHNSSRNVNNAAESTPSSIVKCHIVSGSHGMNHTQRNDAQPMSTVEMLVLAWWIHSRMHRPRPFPRELPAPTSAKHITHPHTWRH